MSHYKPFFILCFAASAAMFCGTGIVSASTIINLDATSTNPASITQSLGAGTYTLTVIGTSTTGAFYNAWNSSSNPSTNNLWTDRYGIQLGSGDQLILVQSGNPGYSTAAAALSAFSAATTLTVYDQTSNTSLSNVANPYSFTLATTTNVTFSIPDFGSYGDDTGGESLMVSKVASASTPEPASGALLGLGLVAAGVARKRRSRNL